MKYDEEHKQEIIKSLDNAIDAFRDFIELGYAGTGAVELSNDNVAYYEGDNCPNLDEDYPDHTDQINFTSLSFDEFLISLRDYRNHLEECLKKGDR